MTGVNPKSNDIIYLSLIINTLSPFILIIVIVGLYMIYFRIANLTKNRMFMLLNVAFTVLIYEQPAIFKKLIQFI